MAKTFGRKSANISSRVQPALRVEAASERVKIANKRGKDLRRAKSQKDIKQQWASRGRINGKSESNIANSEPDDDNLEPTEVDSTVRCTSEVDTTNNDSTEDKTVPKKEEFTKPFRCCSFIAKYPKLAFCLTGSVHVITLCVTLALVFTGYDVFPIDFTGLPLILTDHVTNTRSLAFVTRKIYDNKYHRFTNDGKVGSWDRGSIIDSFELILESTSGNIFGEQNLKLMNEIESRVQALSGYNDVCLTLINGQCDKPWSVLRLFDGTYIEADSSFNASSYQNSTEIVCKGFQNNATSNFVKLFLDTSYNPCDSSSLGSTTRIFFHFGLSSAKDAKSKRSYFQTTYLKPLVNHIANIELLNRINVYYYGLELFIYDAGVQAVADLWWGAGSFIFIFIVMWLQTASLWITFMGLYSIITSFLLANFIYRYCFGYIYFGFFHIAAMFIIIGIGADDVFVFYDTWRLTGNTKYPSKAHRLSHFYKTAAKTTFITSLTTTLAFSATSFSPLLAVKTFGLFSALLVAVNYVFDLLYFPTAVMLYSEIIKPFADDKLLKFYYFIKLMYIRIRKRDQAGTKIDRRASVTTKKFEDRNKVVLFFKNKFYRLMMTRACRILVPLFFVVWSVFFIYWATQLETSTGSVQIFVSSHNYQKAYNMHNTRFQRLMDTDYTDVYLFWGKYEQDVTSCNPKSSAYCAGASEWDDTFNPGTQEAQMALKTLCNELLTMSQSQADTLRIQWDASKNKYDIDCFVVEFESYLQTEETNPIYASSVSLDIPLDKGNMTSFMTANPNIYWSPSSSSFDRWFEIGLEHWLSSGYSGNTSDDIVLYNDLLGAKMVTGQTVLLNNNNIDMAYGTEMKYIAIKIGTTISYQTFSYKEGDGIHDAYENLMQSQLAKMPSTMKNGFQLTVLAWNWIRVQRTLVTYGLQGLGIGVGIALPVLILTTMNVYIGLIATLVIGLVITCVVGLLPLAGYELGVIESLNLCMVVGLSVDYVVHLAEAYRTSPHRDRAGRVKSMLESMGLSVASGAVTTFGAATFMLGSKIHLVFQFGVFVMSIISISFLYALFGFTSFMALCGPEGDSGSLVVLWKKLISSIRKRKLKKDLESTETQVNEQHDSTPARNSCTEKTVNPLKSRSSSVYSIKD